MRSLRQYSPALRDQRYLAGRLGHVCAAVGVLLPAVLDRALNDGDARALRGLRGVSGLMCQAHGGPAGSGSMRKSSNWNEGLPFLMDTTTSRPTFTRGGSSIAGSATKSPHVLPSVPQRMRTVLPRRSRFR